jgi:hypothetical protein
MGEYTSEYKYVGLITWALRAVSTELESLLATEPELRSVFVWQVRPREDVQVLASDDDCMKYSLPSAARSGVVTVF